MAVQRLFISFYFINLSSCLYRCQPPPLSELGTSGAFKKQFNGVAALGMGIFKYRSQIPPRRPLVPPAGTQAEPGAKKAFLCVCGSFLFTIIFPGFTQVAQLRNRGDWGVFMGDKHSPMCPKTATSTPGGSPKLPRAGGTITENEGPRFALPVGGCSHSQRSS